MQRCRDSPAPGNEGIALLPVHRHDRGTAEKPAQLNSVTGLLSGCRQKTDGGGFVIHHADSSLIGNELFNINGNYFISRYLFFPNGSRLVFFGRGSDKSTDT